MKDSTRRRLAALVGTALLGALTVMPASPAAATKAACQTLLSTTPAVEVDTNNDGNPEFRAPRIYDVTLCSAASYGYVTHPPTIDNCSSVPRSVECMAVRITVLPAYAGAHAGGEVCASIEGYGRTCLPFDSGSWDYAAPMVMCIGYDLNGGSPCAGGALLAFE